jgi:phosphatidylserine/phosphatidylglycerophosphate/cardiolipin synthase-like enzyme
MLDNPTAARRRNKIFRKPAPAAADEGRAGTAWRVFRPGRNCWQVRQADNAAIVVDGGPYFAHLEDALRQARQSILIVGWDFDGRIRLRPYLDPAESPPLGELLHSLVEARPELQVRILVWSLAVAHAPGAVMPLLLGAAWQEHPRIQVKLDTKHPIYAAHHQKIICIDDALAFVGGIDLTIDRWDRPEHLPGDPLRADPDGVLHPPVHDLQMVVDGAAAKAVCALGRERWRRATGEESDGCEVHSGTWPSGLRPDFHDVPVAISRSAPAWGQEPALQEAAALTADALAAARDVIYIEAQYMTASYVGDVLCRSLARQQGPEIIVLMTHKSRGFIEQLIMGLNRDRLIRRLKRADRFGRLRIWYPQIATEDGDQQILVHSKLIIVDDLFIRVGSSNLNNRSIGLDTECDLAIEASSDDARRAIIRVRDQLLAEHVGSDPDTVARTIAETGSVIAAVERLNTGTRRLCEFEAMSATGAARPVFGTRLLDPKRPFEPLWFLRRKNRGPRATG